MKKYQTDFLVEGEHGLYSYLIDAPSQKVADEEGRKMLFYNFPVFNGRKVKTHNIVEV